MSRHTKVGTVCLRGACIQLSKLVNIKFYKTKQGRNSGTVTAVVWRRRSWWLEWSWIEGLYASAHA